MPGNYLVWDIITRISPHVTIEWLFDQFEVPEWERMEVYDKILEYIAVIVELQKEKK